MKILAAGAESFHADGDTDIHDEANNTFRSCDKSVQKDYFNFDPTDFLLYSRFYTSVFLPSPSLYSLWIKR